jgi:hypothetical protein
MTEANRTDRNLASFLKRLAIVAYFLFSSPFQLELTGIKALRLFIGQSTIFILNVGDKLGAPQKPHI